MTVKYWAFAVAVSHKTGIPAPVMRTTLVLNVNALEDAQAIAIDRFKRSWDANRFGPIDEWSFSESNIAYESGTIS